MKKYLIMLGLLIAWTNAARAEQNYYRFYRLQGETSEKINLEQLRIFNPVLMARTTYNYYGELRFWTMDGKIHSFRFASPDVAKSMSAAFDHFTRSPFNLSVVCIGSPDRNSVWNFYRIVGSGISAVFGNDPELKVNGDCKFYEIGSMN
jgi:hypothetical protein